MRISTIAYIFKQGFKNIWRNLRFSLASIATMAACIFLFGIFLALVMNFNYIVHSAEEGVAVLVYFDEGIKQELARMKLYDIVFQAERELAEGKYSDYDTFSCELREKYGL